VSVIFDEWLEIDGTDLATHAYFVTSLAPLFTVQKRGSDRVIPNLSGARPYKRTLTVVSVTLSIFVDGTVDEDGVATADARAALYGHLRTLEDALLADVATTAGTRTAVWHQPSGSRTAAVHVESLKVEGQSPSSATCTLELTIPAGSWTDVP
jgi:hypothetical protein